MGTTRVDVAAGRVAEAVEAQVGGVFEAGNKAEAEEVEEREDELGGAVGVGGVLGDRQVRVEDRLKRVEGFALGDGDDLGAVLAVLVGNPVDEVQGAALVPELARHRIAGGGASASGGALPVGA